MSSSDGGQVLRTLADANVQFVVVGEPGGAAALRLVVSRHPTNLEALGRALDRLGSSLRTPVDEAAPGPRRVGDPAGTVAVRTVGGDVDLLFGGARSSLYADTLQLAEERDIGGAQVLWSAAPAPSVTGGRVTGRMLGRRLLSIAEGLAQLMDRHDDRLPGDGPQGAARAGEEPEEPTGSRPSAGGSRAGGGAESYGEPGTSGG